MRRFANLSCIASLLALLSLFVTACGSTTSTPSNSTPTPTAKTVALVTDIGGINDQGFNQLAYTGYEAARQKYGFPKAVIETKSTADYIKNLTEAVRSSDLVIGVGFLMATAVDQVAHQYPHKEFALIDSCADDAKGNCETLPNVAPIFFHEEQAGCLVGAAAAQIELDGKTAFPKLLGKNTIAAVGGLDIPPVDHYIAGYKYCAQQVDKSITVLVDYSQSFDDTAKCADVADSQINQHQADIIFQVAGGCGVGALQAADAKGVYGIGVDKDQASINKSVITSALKRVDQSVSQTIDTFEAGKFSSNIPAFDLKSDGVGYAPLSLGSSAPANVQATVDEFVTKVKSGTITVPQTIP